MRALVAIVVLTGCGRFGFDDLVGDGYGAPDTSGECGSHDEDGDGVGDRCDRCPNVSDDQTDTDGDGVGDACDPSNAAPHRVVLFEPFTDPLEGWPTTGAAQWGVSGDGLQGMYVDTSASSILAPIVIEPPLRITIRYTIDAVDGAASNVTISAVDAFDITSEDSQKCGQASPMRLSIGHEVSGTTVDASNAQFDDSFVVGATYVTTFEHGLGNMTCTTDVPALGAGATVAVQHAPWRGNGRVGVRIRSLGATFHSLLVVAPQ